MCALREDAHSRASRSPVAEVVSAVGLMACYQDWDDEAIINEQAWQWVIANPQILPLDPDANLSSDAGGDPLAVTWRRAHQGAGIWRDKNSYTHPGECQTKCNIPRR